MTEVLITSSVLIAVIALLRAVLRDRIRPGLQYALWGLVLLRLLVPVSWFESPVSVAKAADPIVRQVQHYSAENTRTVALPVTMGEIPQTGEPNEAAHTDIAPLDIARWVWLGGTAVLAVWFLFVNVRLARKLTRERKFYSKTHKIPVYVTKTLPSPCLYLGDIYLTEEAAADPERAEYIIAHELTHRRHLDGVWAALRVVCLAVYWFNPLVWLAAVLSRRDCELFCDASTVKALGEDHRFDYGRTLLDLTAVNVRPGDLICSATTMSGSGKSLKERIARIAQNRKTSVLLAVVVVLIAAIAVGCTFSGGETEMYFEADPEISDPYATPAPERFEEVIGTYDREYWDDVNEVFGPFLTPVNVEVYVGNDYKPQADTLSITFEDLVYSSDSWEFEYFDGWQDPSIAGDLGDATISIEGYDGAMLYVYEGTGNIFIIDAVYSLADNINEGYCILASCGMSGEEMVSALYKWANEFDDMEEFFAPFLDPVAVEVSLSDSYVFPYTPTDTTLEEFIYLTAHAPFTVQYFDQPVLASHEADATIRITAADGRQLIIWNDAGIFLLEDGYLTAEIYGGVVGDSYIVWLYNWAANWPEDLTVAPVESEPVSAGEAAAAETSGHTATSLSYSAPAEPTPLPVATEAVSTSPVFIEDRIEISDPVSTPAPVVLDPSIVPIADTPENLWGENWRDGLTEEQIARLETE